METPAKKKKKNGSWDLLKIQTTDKMTNSADWGVHTVFKLPIVFIKMTKKMLETVTPVSWLFVLQWQRYSLKKKKKVT